LRPTGVTGYDLEDLKVLTLIAGQVARAVSLTRERQTRIDTERLAVIGQMLTGVAHDLRNPMTAISGYAQLMAIDPEAESRQQRCDRILVQIDEMTAMISDLLAFARGHTRLKPTTFEVSHLAVEVEEALRPHCDPRGIHLEINTRGSKASVDVNRAKRILYNLAKNAVDVLKTGGRLRIDLDENSGSLSLRIADDGPGIPDYIRPRLFEPFVSAGKMKGTGLGLSIVKRFVDDHDGHIEVKSMEGEGTTFVVRLPRVDDARAEQGVS
jgi:signal transduction histidine kinase